MCEDKCVGVIYSVIYKKKKVLKVIVLFGCEVCLHTLSWIVSCLTAAVMFSWLRDLCLCSSSWAGSHLSKVSTVSVGLGCLWFQLVLGSPGFGSVRHVYFHTHFKSGPISLSSLSQPYLSLEYLPVLLFPGRTLH